MSALSKYYSSADVTVFLEDKNLIKVDQLVSISLKENYSTNPIYGVGNEYFGFTNHGNYAIVGTIALSFTDNEYLKEAIKYAKGSEVNTYNNNILDSISDTFNLISDEQLKKLKDNKKLDQAINTSNGIDVLPSGFNIRMVFNNGNATHKDLNKTFLIRDVRIVSSGIEVDSRIEGHTIKYYQFIARSMK